MFAGNYGQGGGPGGFVSGGNQFGGAGGVSGHNGGMGSQLYAGQNEFEMDDDGQFNDDYGTEDYDLEQDDDEDDEDLSDDSEMMRLQQRQRQMQQQQMVASQQQQNNQQQQYLGPGSQPLGANLYPGSLGGAGGFQPNSAGSMGMGGGAPLNSQGGGLGNGGGGFTYGMASGAGSVFGAPAAGSIGASGPPGGNNLVGAAQNQAVSSAGGISFGQASQFGGIGSIGGGAGMFSSGGSSFGTGGLSSGMVGGLVNTGATDDDPYANIDIDLSKVKTAVKPGKPFEQKTEEEKVADAERRGSIKSNLKTTKEDFEKAKQNKKEVRFGKSITYQVNSGDEENNSDDDVDEDSGEKPSSASYNKSDLAKDGVAAKKIVEEKDLSDGRDEAEKIKEQLEREQKEQLEAIERMNEWKRKQAQKEASGSESVIEKMRLDAARLKAAEGLNNDSEVEEDEESSEISQKGRKHPRQGGPRKGLEESYASDSFEDVSVSGSGSRAGVPPSWHSKNRGKSVEDSMKSGSSGGKAKVLGESSSNYDEDAFDSLSKSQNALNQLLKDKQMAGGVASNLKTLKGSSKQATLSSKYPAGSSSVASAYIRKENKQTMTDQQTKYDFMSAEEALGENPKSYSERLLKRDLEDAHLLIQELKAAEADLKEEMRQKELDLQKKDNEYNVARREAYGATKTIERLTEQVVKEKHANNLYRVQVESLIKEVDLADARAREKEDALVVRNAEIERELAQQDDRLKFWKSKNEERALTDLKHAHSVSLAEQKALVKEKQEDVDYLNEKVNKLMVENEQLLLRRDSKAETKKLTDEIQSLKKQLAEVESKGSSATSHTLKSLNSRTSPSASESATQQQSQSAGQIKANLSAAEQMELQKEVAHQKRIIDGMNKENEKVRDELDRMRRQQKDAVKQEADKLKQQTASEMRSLVATEQIVVVQDGAEVPIETANIVGQSNAISQKELQDLRQRIKSLLEEADGLKRDSVTKESTLKAITERVRNEKTKLEKQIVDIEFVVGEKTREIEKIRDQNLKERTLAEQQIKELQEKIGWYRENQKLLGDTNQTNNELRSKLSDALSKCKTAEEDRQRARDLEKTCKLLEETIKSKNPNSIPMMIKATQDVTKNEEEDRSKKQLQFRVKNLEAELDERDKDFERRIRSLRQELERMKGIYEERSKNPAEAIKVNELEDELSKTKAYYNKRIREIEDKYRYRVPVTPAAANSSTSQQQSSQDAGPPSTAEKKPISQSAVVSNSPSNATNAANQAFLKKEIEEKESEIHRLQAMLKELTAERNHFAQKLVETQQKLQQFQNSASMHPTSPQVLSSQQPKISLHDDQDQHNRPVNQQLNPFMTETSQSGPRPVPILMDALKSANLGAFSGKMLRVGKLTSALTGVASLEEVQNLRQFLAAQKATTHSNRNENGEENGEDNEATPVDAAGRSITSGNDYIDMDELIEAVNLRAKLVGQQQHHRQQPIQQIQPNFYQQPSPQQYYANAQQQSLQQQQVIQAADPEEVQVLQRQVKRVLREKDDDAEFYASKIRQLKRQLTDANLEKGELSEQVNKLVTSKRHLEKFFKDKMGIPLDTNGNMTGQFDPQVKSGALLGEVSMIQKRIEFLEEQADQRNKMAQSDVDPFKREIARLNQELEAEKALRSNLISKKNAEISYFKNELDSLLGEIQSTSTRSSPDQKATLF